jgi:hypothetical protein
MQEQHKGLGVIPLNMGTSRKEVRKHKMDSYTKELSITFYVK